MTVAARLLRQCTSHETLADSGRSEHENVLMTGHPLGLLRETTDCALVQPTRRSIVDIFDGSAFQFGGTDVGGGDASVDSGASYGCP